MLEIDTFFVISLFLFFSGFISGILAGSFGFGGGIIIVPIIYHLSQKVFLADNFRKKILQKLITKKNCDVLDIGCGPGNMVNYLSYKKYYGFDTDKNLSILWWNQFFTSKNRN